MPGHIRPLSYHEQVDVIVGLFTRYDVSVDDTTLRNRIATVQFHTLRRYLDDIGIVIAVDRLGSTINVSSINEDVVWVRRKLELIYSHMGKMIND